MEYLAFGRLTHSTQTDTTIGLNEAYLWHFGGQRWVQYSSPVIQSSGPVQWIVAPIIYIDKKMFDFVEFWYNEIIL